MAGLIQSIETSTCLSFRRISTGMLLDGLPSSPDLRSPAQETISIASSDELTLYQPFSREESLPSLCLIDFDKIDRDIRPGTPVSSPLAPPVRSNAPSPASLYTQYNTGMAEALDGHHNSPVSGFYLGRPKSAAPPLPTEILSLHERFFNRLKEEEAIIEGVNGQLKLARNVLDTSHSLNGNQGATTSLRPLRMPSRTDNPNEVKSTYAHGNFAVSGATRECILEDNRQV
ncbi:hypothetical protein BGZ60DRAFT_426058 [Tricladium varicosporioides]|nr:hypothetical protein BGZ60DRAFT_426058 [Hymenoscyphus varicosporioides]